MVHRRVIFFYYFANIHVDPEKAYTNSGNKLSKTIVSVDNTRQWSNVMDVTIETAIRDDHTDSFVGVLCHIRV